MTLKPNDLKSLHSESFSYLAFKKLNQTFWHCSLMRPDCIDKIAQTMRSVDYIVKDKLAAGKRVLEYLPRTVIESRTNQNIVMHVARLIVKSYANKLSFSSYIWFK